MSLLTHYKPNALKLIVDVSSYWEQRNANNYTAALHDALEDLYEYTPCGCDTHCECKAHGCTHHWTLRKELTFHKVFEHFLACYVDAKARRGVREAVLEAKLYDGRARNAVTPSTWVEKNFANLVNGASRSLLCTDWDTLAKQFKFNIYEGRGAARTPAIYKSKWMAFLGLDTYVAYDNGSARLLSKDFGAPRSYTDLMTNLRDALLEHLRTNRISINDFRGYSNWPKAASLAPIGLVLDRLYLTL